MIPALQSNGVAPHLSDRYVRIDSNAVIAALEQEGFKLYGARQDRVRARDPLFARHELDLRHPDFDRLTLSDGTVPRMLFINSHNGTTRAKFMLGMYRFICSNGMVVGNTWAKGDMHHMGDSARQAVDRIREASKLLGQVVQKAQAMSKKDLTRAQQLELATAAMKVRHGEDGPQRYDPQLLLTPMRAEDEGSDLWRTFNRIQENGTKTRMIGVSANGRRTMSRGLNNISADHTWNTELWSLAEALV
jgi:hypothetical protein